MDNAPGDARINQSDQSEFRPPHAPEGTVPANAASESPSPPPEEPSTSTDSVDPNLNAPSSETEPKAESPAPDGDAPETSPYASPADENQSSDYYPHQAAPESSGQESDSSSESDPTTSEGSEPPSGTSDGTVTVESDDEEEGGGPVKPFLEHLEDLRWTLVKSLTAVFLGMLICLVAGKYLVFVMMWPLKNAERFFQRTHGEVAILMGTNVIARVQPDDFGGKVLWGTNQIASLHVVPMTVGTNTVLTLQPHLGPPDVPPPTMVVIKNYSPIEGIIVAMKLALYGGLVLSLPFVFYFIGQFVLPALRVKEKNILYQAAGFGGGLFLLGVFFCYFIVAVFALGATVEFSRWLGFGADEWRADAYLSFMAKFMLGMGLAFELPVVILVLVKIGLLDYDKLKRFRSYAIVANLVISAFATPSGDPFTMMIMAVPLQFLYEISVFIAWYWERRDRKRAAAEAAGK